MSLCFNLPGFNRAGSRRVLLAVLLGLPGCLMAAVRVESAWVGEVPPASPVAAAYLTLVNEGAAPVRVLSLTSPLAASVEWHDMWHADGMMRMQRRRDIVLPARSRTVLAPSGSHLMLNAPTQALPPGSVVPLRLALSGGQVLSVQAVVRARDAEAMPSAHVH